MSRNAREKSSSGVFHVILRGVNKQIIFEEDADKEKFLRTVHYYKAISKYTVLGYCLMNNHIHLLLKENDESISTAIKRIASSYVRWYNTKYERCGHLFQERFKSEAVENEAYLLTALRYIHQNPVKAGLSKSAADYKWSSYKDYVGKSTLSDIDNVLQIISINREYAIELFISFTNVKNDDECLDYDIKPRFKDNEIRNVLATYGIADIYELQHVDKARRNQIIGGLKATKRFSLRQLSRVTGFSKGMIEKIGCVGQ